MRGAVDMVIHSGWRCVILLSVLAGCNRQPEKSGHVVTDSAPLVRTRAGGGELVAVPTEKTDSIRIEGVLQPIKLRLVQPPSNVPFLTYVPEDMISETRASRAGEAHYFFANFGGKRNREAYLLMNVLAAGTTKETAVAIAKAFRSAGAKAGYVVTMDLRMHGNRYYIIGEHYPQEYSEGLAPRLGIVQREWKWLDATPSAPPYE